MREMKDIDIEATDNMIIEENIVGEDLDMTGEVQVIEEDFSEDSGMDYGMEDEMWTDIGMETGMDPGMAEVKDPLLSSWSFTIGISSGVFIISIVLGVLLAKLKIKKGIDLYED